MQTEARNESTLRKQTHVLSPQHANTRSPLCAYAIQNAQVYAIHRRNMQNVGK